MALLSLLFVPACEKEEPEPLTIADTSVEEVDDWANGGGEDPRPDALAACDVLEEIMSRCYEYGEVDEPSSDRPMPG